MAPGEPDKRSSQNDGNEYVRVTVAVNTVMGEERRETEFIAVNLYENHMRSAMSRATKGTPVYISGRMSHREYQRQDGTRGCELHVHARDFRILHRAPEGQSYVPAANELPQAQSTDQPANELPHGQDQSSDQSSDNTMGQSPDQDLAQGLEEDLDFNDPQPLGPESTPDEDAPAPQEALNPSMEDNFESAVETAAFSD